MSILWIILIGFIAGVLAKLITAGSLPCWGPWARLSPPISAKLSADTVAQVYRATVGAIIVLLVWGAIARRRGPVT